MPSKGGNKPATQAGLAAVKSELRSEIKSVETALKGDIAAVKSELRSEIKSAETALRSEIKSVETALKGDIAAVKVYMIRRFDDTLNKQDGVDIKKQLDRIVAVLDSFVGEAADNKRSFAVQGSAKFRNGVPGSGTAPRALDNTDPEKR